MTLFGLIAAVALPVAVLLCGVLIAVLTLWICRLDARVDVLEAERHADTARVWPAPLDEGARQ